MAEPRRGDVLVVRRRLGFGANGRREHFVVLQSDMLQRDLDTVVVAPLDDDLPLYASDPLVVHVRKREAGTAAPQVVLIPHLSSVLRERFEPVRAGRLRASSMSDVDRLVAILLELRAPLAEVVNPRLVARRIDREEPPRRSARSRRASAVPLADGHGCR